jgi:hypothetical protein
MAAHPPLLGVAVGWRPLVGVRHDRIRGPLPACLMCRLHELGDMLNLLLHQCRLNRAAEIQAEVLGPTFDQRHHFAHEFTDPQAVPQRVCGRVVWLGHRAVSFAGFST